MRNLKLNIRLDPDLDRLAKLWPEDRPLYLVGGVVRDYVYAHYHGGAAKPKDYDAASQLTADEVKELLKKNRIPFTEQGAAFGIIVARPNGKEFEIASFREEWYDPELGDGRRPDQVKQGTTPAIDASRRDLTINALFYDIRLKEVQDYNDGQGLTDILYKRVRPVGNAKQRFQEDKLRVLRLIRFFSRYNDGHAEYCLDPDTQEAISEFAHLTGVSGERKLAEFLAGIEQSIYPQNYLMALNKFGLLAALFPGLKVNRLGVLNIRGVRNPKVIIANLLKDNDPAGFNHPKTGLGNALRFPAWLTDGVEFILSVQKWGFDPKDALKMLRRRDKFLRPDMTEDERKAAIKLNETDLNEWAMVSFWGGPNFDWQKAKVFLDYQSKVKAQTFIDQGLVGKELGAAMVEAEAKGFEESLRAKGF